MDPKTRSERQEDRVWCLEQLIRLEGCLDPRMYECADYATSAGSVSYTHLTLPTICSV